MNLSIKVSDVGPDRVRILVVTSHGCHRDVRHYEYRCSRERAREEIRALFDQQRSQLLTDVGL